MPAFLFCCVDFSSAFDPFQSHVLLQKMIQINVNPFIIKWFYSFFTDRTQNVRIINSLSEPKQNVQVHLRAV